MDPCYRRQFVESVIRARIGDHPGPWVLHDGCVVDQDGVVLVDCWFDETGGEMTAAYMEGVRLGYFKKT